jgi:hypothetical protein
VEREAFSWMIMGCKPVKSLFKCHALSLAEKSGRLWEKWLNVKIFWGDLVAGLS